MERPFKDKIKLIGNYKLSFKQFLTRVTPLYRGRSINQSKFGQIQNIPPTTNCTSVVQVVEMEKSKDSQAGYEYAYKKKSTTVDKRALRLHRRSIEWKSNREERLNSARNLESLSPLQEISHNTTTDKSYDGKTPTKSSNISSEITKQDTKG